MEEKQKPSLIERRLYARILQIMEDKKPYLDPQFNLCQLANLACTNSRIDKVRHMFHKLA